MPNRPTPAAPTRAPVITPARRTVAGTLAGGAAVALALAVAAIKPNEGLWLTAKADPLVTIPTDCYGHTGPDVRLGQRHTPAECDAILTADVRREISGIEACVPKIDAHPQQLGAATDLAHNIGVSAFCHSGTASAFRRDDWRHGCDLMLAWDKVSEGGKLVRVAGLAARRERERAMCLVGVAS